MCWVLSWPPGFARPRTRTSCGPAAAAGPLVWQEPCPPPHLPADAISHSCLQTSRRRSGTSGCRRLGANRWQEGLATPQRLPPSKALSQPMAQHAALSPRLSVLSSLVWAGLVGGVPVLWGALQNPSQCSATTAPLPFTACPESCLTVLGVGLCFRAESLTCPEPAWR